MQLKSTSPLNYLVSIKIVIDIVPVWFAVPSSYFWGLYTTLWSWSIWWSFRWFFICQFFLIFHSYSSFFGSSLCSIFLQISTFLWYYLQGSEFCNHSWTTNILNFGYNSILNFIQGGNKYYRAARSFWLQPHSLVKSVFFTEKIHYFRFYVIWNGVISLFIYQELWNLLSERDRPLLCAAGMPTRAETDLVF